MQRLLLRIIESCVDYGLRLNTSKTKYVIVSKQLVSDPEVEMNGKSFQRVEKIKNNDD